MLITLACRYYTRPAGIFEPDYYASQLGLITSLGCSSIPNSHIIPVGV